MLRGKILPIGLAALFVAGVSGCTTYYEDGYYGSPYYGGSYYGGYYGGYYGPYYPVYRHDGHKRHDRHDDKDHGHDDGHHDDADGYDRYHGRFDRRDWREGDGEYRRRWRDQSGLPLEERRRRDRQERFDEDLKTRADDAAGRRAASPGGATGEIGAPVRPHVRESADDRAFRRLERSTQAERQAQREAAENRRELLERQAEKESLPLVPPGGAGAKTQR